MESMRSKGYCWASWQPEVVALSTAFPSSEGTCVINVSVSTQEQADRWIKTLAPHLLRLKADICLELSKRTEP
jgi:hypothetical protein